MARPSAASWPLLPGAAWALGAWRTGLQGTHYWDCNGQGCDATILQPFDKTRYVAAPQYAPADPADFGGPVYGEMMWLTGAASDGLAHVLGPDSGCCGSDKDSGGCGRCLLVRNPSAANPDWTAVVMKKSRCPPESNGCELPKVHLDIAAPGYDNITVSTANVCGKPGIADTYISALESGVCASTHGGCTCDGMPNNTETTRILKNGCLLFGRWGWTSGDPMLEWQPVDCPARFEERIAASFTAKGVENPSPTHYWPWVAVGVAIVLLALASCLIVRILDNRREAKEAARRKIKKEQRERESLKRRNFGGQATSESSSSSSASSSDTDG